MDKNLQEHKIRDIFINSSKHELVDLPDKHHMLGKDNGCPSTLWVKYKEFITDDIEYIPWIDIGANRLCWDIQIKQRNSINYKYLSTRINGDTLVIIKLNNKPFYEFTTYKLEYAFNKAQNIIYQLEEHPLVIDNEDVVGRKIYYKNLPAIIVNSGIGYVIIKPDCKEDELDKWWLKYGNIWDENDDEQPIREDIKDDILSPNIFWYR